MLVAAAVRRRCAPPAAFHSALARASPSTSAARLPSAFLAPALSPSSSSPFRSLHTTAFTMLALTKWRGTAANPSAPAPRTLAAQDALPRLPVPPLAQTLAKYVRSIEPIVRQAEEKGELPGGKKAEEVLEERKRWAQELLDSRIGETLQARLEDVDATTPNNWLDDRYWLQKAYHEWRVPLLVNSNWWLLFTNDPALFGSSGASAAAHEGHGQGLPTIKPGADAAALPQPLPAPEQILGEKRWDEMQFGIRRAAWLAWRLVEFKLRLDREDILPDASRAGPFCMHQYTNVYGVTRIPALPHDWNTRPAARVAGVPASKVARGADAPARHITVIVRDHYYALQVVDDAEGKIVRPEALEAGLQAIVDDVRARGDDGPGVGVLTADERDRWAVNREALIAVDPTKNKAALRSIERSLFAVSLDTSVLPLPPGHAAPPSSASPRWVDALARNVCGAGRGARNRWFDKSMNLVVEPNGRAGINGEHSPVDALIPSILADYATGVPCAPPGQPFPAVETTPASELSEARAGFARVDFALDDALRAEIGAAQARAAAVGANADVRVLYYDEYGADWIKKGAKQSPDAYLQQALQLAMALTAGWQVPTYETASTRLFKHGRTDVIRSFSPESYALVQALLRPRSDAERDAKHRYKLLSAATQAHNAQTREASMGAGIDRHLTGLRLVFDAQRDGEVPKLLADDLFGQSQTWTLSTSGLSAGDRLAGTGFGAGYPDGYGCNYLAGGKLLKFGLESKHAHPQTSTTTFAQNLVKALRLLREVCEQGQDPAAAADGKGKL